MTRLERALYRITSDLNALKANWAVIGGLAINVHVDPRTTQDIDFAISVASDHAAEELVRQLRARGYRDVYSLEQEATGRLATVRLELTEIAGVSVDLMFASSGIEPEIAQQARREEILPSFEVPVARIGHLIALKILAAREIDLRDARQLLAIAKPEDLALAQDSLELIARRGFDRGKDLAGDFQQLRRSS